MKPDGVPDPEHPEPRHRRGQAKLDELVRATPKAANSFIGIEHLTAEEFEDVLVQCEQTINTRRSAPKPFALKGPRVKPVKSAAKPAFTSPARRKLAS